MVAGRTQLIATDFQEELYLGKKCTQEYYNQQGILSSRCENFSLINSQFCSK